MTTHPVKKLTIVVESILEERLTRELQAVGMKGYTAYEVRGQGLPGGATAADFENATLKLETLIPADVADKALEHLAREYFPHYSVIAYVEEVQVVRGSRYGK